MLRKELPLRGSEVNYTLSDIFRIIHLLRTRSAFHVHIYLDIVVILYPLLYWRISLCRVWGSLMSISFEVGMELAVKNISDKWGVPYETSSNKFPTKPEHWRLISVIKPAIVAADVEG